MFKLISNFRPTGDQPQAIEKLAIGVKSGLKNQVLLGVTGSGKTFTMANIIKNLNMPALIISHNKTLAGQLYQEMRDFFPHNGVSYFVSYYDFYQPEAYIPQTDTYIEKEAEINDLIDKLRLRATSNIMTREDVVVVASVSCIYNIGSPHEYERFMLEVTQSQQISLEEVMKRLVTLLYERSEFDFKRGTFRLRGNKLDVYPAYEDFGYRLEHNGFKIAKITKFEPLSGKQLSKGSEKSILIYPAKHYLTDPAVFQSAEAQIRGDLHKEYEALKKNNKLLEAERLLKRVNYDLEVIKEIGYVNGIENYSRYFDGRRPGEPPYSLLDYFKTRYGNNFLVFIDESHMTVPQLRGMFNGDHARKKMLIDFGFRLQSAFDNRPLRFEEFYQHPPHLIYVSATPSVWEMERSKLETQEKNFTHHEGVVEQLIRPTGIIDPRVTVKPAEGEIQDLIREIEKRIAKGEKVLVTTLTKKTAEDLSEYLKEKNIRASYLHSDILTLERSDILDNLRRGEFDVLIGINLLREGLDLPEVSLVAILDADREGFLRSRTALIQTMGRAARNIEGEVIIYADKMTRSMQEAISEIERRRVHQLAYNKTHNIKPITIKKPIRGRIADQELALEFLGTIDTTQDSFLDTIKADALTPFDKKKIVRKLDREMRAQAKNLNFELAIRIRDKIGELKP